MEKAQFTDKERQVFQEKLKLFIEQVDRCIENGKTTLGVQKTSLKEQMDQVLKHINYVCHPNFGSGNLSEIPTLSFYRNDLFSMMKINGVKPSLKFGIYIWFGYSYDEQLYYLKFAFPKGDINNSRCDAVNKMEQDGICDPNGKYYFIWEKSNKALQEVTDKFLILVNYFNRFPAKDFQNHQIKQVLEKAFNNFQDKLYQYNNQTPQELQLLANENKIRILQSSKTQNSGLYLLKAKEKGIKALAINSNDPFDNHISCADFLRYCNNEKTTYAWAKPIYDLILEEEYKNTSVFPQDINNDKGLNNSNIPLNQILYGSPGTGKTYSTIDKALEILGVDTKSKNRQELKEIFEDYKAKGQIEFVTFHQNYGYEEFVEGIKPKLDENNGENNKLEYEIKEGIFKRICERARQNTKDFLEKIHQNYHSNESIDFERDLWRLYTLPNGDIEEDYFKECIEKNHIYAYKSFGMEKLEKEVKIGDYIIIPSTKYGRRSKSIRAFGVFTNETPEFEDKKNEESENKKMGYRSVKWYWFTENQDEELIFENVNFAQQTFARVNKSKNIILDYFDTKLKNTTDDTPKNHILIIDEINRGNVSKIFGELITLIEPSKRIGADEELQVTLPYSQESFGVPSNLYIIGTMNTADRSITSLDTALRRRFEFVEMMPDPTKLSDKTIEGIELDKLLQAINERIEFLYDREKTIGHAYFLEVDSLDKLKEVFQNKIIPLLQEYFYNDYEAIQAVLNDNGMIEPSQKDNQAKEDDYLKSSAFKNYINDRGIEKKIFKIAPKDKKEVWNEADTYKKIYKSIDTKQNNDNTQGEGE